MSTLDHLIANVASKQFGVVSLDQLTSVGATPSAVRSRVARGMLVPLWPRTFRVGGAPLTWHMQLFAGQLSLGPGTLVSHRAAAQLHRFDSFDRDELEFTLPSKRRLKHTPSPVHTTKRLSRLDRAKVEQFACTSASRTIIDLASQSVSATMLGNAIDSAIRDGLSSPSFLRRRLAALRSSGVAGVRRLDELMIDSGGHSTLERRFLRLMRESGLPRPRCQVIHRRDGTTFARVDFEFEPLPLVVEVSGRRGHVTEVDRRRDARRRNELQSEGFTVLEFTTVDVVDGSSHVSDTVRSHVRRLASKSTA